MKSYKDARYEQLRKSGAHALEGEELRRLQQTLLEMYLDVQAVCEENGLTCFVEGGTRASFPGTTIWIWACCGMIMKS